MFNIKKIYWNEVSETVQQLNQELASICAQLEPNHDYYLYEITYPYGSCIVDKGVFNLPKTDGTLIPISDKQVPKEMKNDLDYCKIPLSLLINNDSEVFIDATDRIVPLNFFSPGELFGVFESISALNGTITDPIWSVTAGARSVFFLPKISNKLSHGRIKKTYGILHSAPHSLLEQWSVFKEIYSKVGSVKTWNTKILVFPRKWVNSDSVEISWLKLQKYLFKIGWDQAQILRDSVHFGLLWASFSKIISNKALKPSPYIVDTLKHIISIANGSGVGFKPATDESALPVKALQEVYVNCYQLDHYIPTIMQPCKLNCVENDILYYSLAFPTTLESSPIIKNAPSIIEDEREIRMLLNIFMKEIKSDKTIQYNLFHTNVDKFGEISNSKEIIVRDSRFGAYKQSSSRKFCATSTFFRGCIQIAKNSEG